MIFAGTLIWDGEASQLGSLFEAKGPNRIALGTIERPWLDALSHRAARDPTVRAGVDQMMALLRQEDDAAGSVGRQFTDIFDCVREHAYPVSSRLLRDVQRANSVGGDDTLSTIDRGIVRALEDRARDDHSYKSFVDEMAKRLTVREEEKVGVWASGLYEVFGEALVYYLLKDRLPQQISIRKVPETDKSSPDFECVWTRRSRDPLTFYIEVKSLNVVDGQSRLNEMRGEGFENALEVERQLGTGRAVGMATRVIAPYKPFARSPDYDPFSLRLMIESIQAKIAGAFKPQQFTRGPTFALANLSRLAHMSHGPGALRRRSKGKRGTAITGAWWSVAYGQIDSPIEREPEFEGASGEDGVLGRAGFLVDPAVTAPAAGLLLLIEEERQYRLAGMKAVRQSRSSGWRNTDANELLTILCDAWNDRSDSKGVQACW